MKNRARNLMVTLTVLLIFDLQSTTAVAQGTAFTYQGQLQDNGSPASGTYNLQFLLYTNSSSGPFVAGPLTTNGVVISNGLFTVTMDFGSAIWNGQTNWLEIIVQTNGGNFFAILRPRQQLTPVPYAIYAEEANAAGLIGTIPTSSLSGTYGGGVSLTNRANNFTGNGAGLVNVNASLLGGLGPSNFWQTTGNSGTAPGRNFLGTADNEPLELWVNQARALRLEPGNNTNSVIGAPNVIGGAPNNYVDPDIYGATIAGGGAVIMTGYLAGPSSNHVSAIFGTIGGGRLNTVGADHGTIGGGIDNTIQSQSYDCVIAGGNENTIMGGNSESVISGGIGNTNGGPDSSIGGGYVNLIAGNFAYYGFVGGGQYNVLTNGFEGVIAGGSGNFNSGFSCTIGGGTGNSIDGGSLSSTIAGGQNNVIVSGGLSTIAGGLNNTINDPNSQNSTIGGGVGNIISNYDNSATISGGAANTIQTNAYASYIGGGNNNTILALAQYGTVAGGAGNTAGAYGTTVSGGQQNTAGAGDYATVSGGDFSTASGYAATVGGGQINISLGSWATVPGGELNYASGAYSFAAGQYGQALHTGAFVWSDDSSNTPFASTTANQFNVRAMGGVRLVTGGAGMTLDGQSVVPSGNYVFSYSTMFQSVTTPNTFQAATFNNDAQISGWGHAFGSSQYFCLQNGLYLVQYTAQVLVADSMSVRATVNSIEVPGSQAYITFGGPGLATATVITKSFLASVSSGGSLTIQYTGSSLNDFLAGGGSGSTEPSISLTITRIQ